MPWKLINLHWLHPHSLFLPQDSHFLFPYDSGDTDAVIPVTSTRYTIDALNLTTVSPWRPWYDDGQVNDCTIFLFLPTFLNQIIAYSCFCFWIKLIKSFKCILIGYSIKL